MGTRRCSGITRSPPLEPTLVRCCTSACARDRRTRARGCCASPTSLIARVTRTGASGVKLLRADSGFWNSKVFKRLETAGWQYLIGVRMQKAIREAVQAIEESAWQTIEDYPKEGEAQIAETVYGDWRLIVRRTRLIGPQAELWPDWRHFAFLTNRTEEIALVESEHRDHAVVEQVIVDLKDQALAHFPSGEFNANGAWSVLGRSLSSSVRRFAFEFIERRRPPLAC